MKHTATTRFLSLLMALVMILTAAPLQVFATETHVHAYTSSVTTEATCGAEGVTTYTCNIEGCDNPSYTEAIPATGEHNYENGLCACGAADPNVVVPVSEDQDSVIIRFIMFIGTMEGAESGIFTVPPRYDSETGEPVTEPYDEEVMIKTVLVPVGTTIDLTSADLIPTANANYTFRGWCMDPFGENVMESFTVAEQHLAANAEGGLYFTSGWTMEQPPVDSETEEYYLCLTVCGNEITSKMTEVEPGKHTVSFENVEVPYGATPAAPNSVPNIFYCVKNAAGEVCTNGRIGGFLDVAGTYNFSFTFVEETKQIQSSQPELVAPAIPEFVVTFNANKGTGTMEPQKLGKGALKKNTFVYENYEFTGWNTKADGTGKAYADGEEVTLSADLVLYAQWKDVYYKTISHKSYELAPGIVESEIYLNNSTGTHQQVAHVVEVDINNPYTKVIPSYKGMIPTPGSYGVQVMSKQVDFAEANGYGNVVAAMNLSLSWYDSEYYKQHPELVGEPLGYMILDGVQYTNSNGKTSGAQTCLVINFDEKDGVARPSNIPKTEIRATSSAITGWEEQVIPANFGFLVKDGKNQYAVDHNPANGASRSFVGIKANGDIVMVMNDGRQAPYSTGFSNYEMAEFMLSLGCVYAVNGDGGGSSAFLSQRPGEEMKINCKPSDGAERETTHGILVISTAPATGEFVRANISSEEEYYTPNSSVQFTAIGTDLVGTATEIPEEAEWKLADDSFGTIENGLFVSNGKEGVVAVQLVYNDEVVGQDTINIVMPDKLTFQQENMVVPFGKTVDLALSATYNYKNVVLKAEDVTFVLDNETIGTIDGFDFIAAEEGIENPAAVLTAKVGEVSAVTNISLGRGSVVVYDFEDQNLDGWNIKTNYGQYGPMGSKKDENGNYYYNGQNELGYISIVDASNGMVKNGEHALAVECDFTQIYETGYHALNLIFPTIDCTDSVAIGFWLYVPYDSRHAEMLVGAGGYGNGEAYLMKEGWHYITAQAKDNKFYYINISVDDRACAATGAYYDYINEPNLNGKFTYYIDDITVDYSTAVDDRENPIFSAPVIQSISGETSSVMVGQTIGYNTITVEAAVVEDTSKSNATGLNPGSAEAYVDGKPVACTFTGGKITVPGLVLADGYHTVKFAISDNMGNTTWTSGDINIAAGNKASTVKVVPQDAEADRVLIGSLYWMDVVATNIETIDKVEMVLDLNNGSKWELAGMTVAPGFDATYNIREDDNVATITITRTGKNTSTGEAVLASFPVRTWESTITQYPGYGDQTPAKLVKRGIIWKKAIELELQKGIITFVKNTAPETTGTFGMKDLVVATDIFFTNYSRKSVAGAQETISKWTAAGTGWHEHVSSMAADKAATCTESGYTGRTWCAGCESFLTWGTTIPATGHNHQATDGVLKCECGDVYTGTGLVEVNGTSYYLIAGALQSGWIQIEGDWYYFDANTFAPVATMNNGYVTFSFEANGKLVSGQWYHGTKGSRYFYGPDYYKGRSTTDLWVTIDGNDYCFNLSGYRMTGYSYTRINQNDMPIWYDFGDDGISRGKWDYTGLATQNGYYYCVVDGVTRMGIHLFDGAYYYGGAGNYYAAVTNITRRVDLTNGLLPAGVYTFGVDGKMVDKTVYNVDNTLYYFEMGKKSQGNGVYTVNGEDYTIEADGKVLFTGVLKDASGQTLDYVDGVHVHVPKNGPDGDYFYVNDVVQKAWKLVEWEGNYYFINDYNKLAKNAKLYLGEQFVAGHTYPNGDPMKPGYYEFDAQGKMVIINGIHGDYYYVNGIVEKAWKLIKVDGDYYFINGYNKLAKNTKLYLGEQFVAGHTYPHGDPMLPGLYEFDAEGKIIIKNGIYGDYYYVNGVLQKAWKLIKVDGDYYFINDYDKLAKNKTLYLGEVFVRGFEDANGNPLKAGLYKFGADGKMILE